MAGFSNRHARQPKWISLSARVRQLPLFSWIEINSPRRIRLVALTTFHARRGLSTRSPNLQWTSNLYDVSYFAHAFNCLFLISAGNSLEGIHSVQFAFSDLRAWRGSSNRHARQWGWITTLSVEVR